MNKTTFNQIWEEMVKKEANAILDMNSFDYDVLDNKTAKKNVSDEYDRLRSYAKIKYLRDPEGYSNRYLVCSYLTMAIAKVRPLNVGKSEGNLLNEKLALRVGVRMLALFKSYESENEVEKDFWNNQNIAQLVFEQLGKDYEERLCYYLYYDIEERTYSILELANIIWIIEAYMLIDINRGQILEKPQYATKRYINKEYSYAYDRMWDNIWEEVIERKAKRIVDQNVGEVVFDKSSKRLILKAVDKVYYDANAKYVRLRNLSVDKYIFCACLILAIAKVQPLEYKHDNHDLKGIYNENLAIEVGLSMLYHMTKKEIDYKRYNSRFKFPSVFQSKTYKELLCLMLYYDVEANHYSTLAIANILYMIVLYTKASYSINRKTHDVLLTYIQMIIKTDNEGNIIPWENGELVKAFYNERDDKIAQENQLSLFIGIDLQSRKIMPLISETYGSDDYISFLELLNKQESYEREHRIRLVYDKYDIIKDEKIKKYLAQKSNSERFDFLFSPKLGSWLNMIDIYLKTMIKQMLERIQFETKEELKDSIMLYFDGFNNNSSHLRWKDNLNEIVLSEDQRKVQ